MITVIRKTIPPHKREDFSESSSNLISGIVNWHLTVNPHVWSPPTDVFEVQDALIVRVEIAGMKESSFSVSLDQGNLIISGSRTDINEKCAYHQMEIHSGEFRTGVEITLPIELDDVTAEYNDGFLTVRLPKKLPHRINVNVNEAE